MKKFFKGLFEPQVVSVSFTPLQMNRPVINKEISEVISLIHKAGELELEGHRKVAIELLNIAIFQCVNQKDRISRELKKNMDSKDPNNE